MRSGARLLTYSTWLDGVECLLPETHLVLLADHAGFGCTVPWRGLVRELRGWVERLPDTDPPRWGTLGWPGVAAARLRWPDRCPLCDD
jgi:hypothetical protein